jgi:hypothetical protein
LPLTVVNRTTHSSTVRQVAVQNQVLVGYASACPVFPRASITQPGVRILCRPPQLTRAFRGRLRSCEDGPSPGPRSAA